MSCNFMNIVNHTWMLALSVSNAVSEVNVVLLIGWPKKLPSVSIWRKCSEIRELHFITPLSLRGDSLLEEQQEAAVDVVAVLLLVL